MTKRHKLSVLRKRIGKVREETESARVAKRAKKAERDKAQGKTGVPSWDLTSEDCGQTPEKVLTSYHVQAWFREAITKRISWSVTLPSNEKWWGGKQRTLAKKLLDAYGGELLKKAIFYLCDNWEEMIKTDTGLSGVPTVELLWGGRDRIFPMAERGLPFVAAKRRTVSRRSEDADEFVEPDEKDRRHGW